MLESSGLRPDATYQQYATPPGADTRIRTEKRLGLGQAGIPSSHHVRMTAPRWREPMCIPTSDFKDPETTKPPRAFWAGGGFVNFVMWTSSGAASGARKQQTGPIGRAEQG